MFPKNNKMRLLLECLWEGWEPYRPKCKRGAETIALTKSGWIIEFQTHHALLFRPWRQRYIMVKRLAYKDIAFVDPQKGFVELQGHKPYGVGFSLRTPELGFLGLPARMPDFKFLRQFAGPIQELSERLGRAPMQKELVNHVHDLIEGALSKKKLEAIYHEGEGYFWETNFVIGPPKRREYYLRPGVGIKEAKELWEGIEGERTDSINRVDSWSNHDNKRAAGPETATAGEP